MFDSDFHFLIDRNQYIKDKGKNSEGPPKEEWDTIPWPIIISEQIGLSTIYIAPNKKFLS